jgi:hypothetical protein
MICIFYVNFLVKGLLFEGRCVVRHDAISGVVLCHNHAAGRKVDFHACANSLIIQVLLENCVISVM